MIAQVAEGVARTPRGYIGLSVRCAIDFIAERGLTSVVRADATPATRRAMDNPPSQLGWHDAAVLDELESLLERHGGREACVDLGHYAGVALGSGIVQPVLAFAMQIFGGTPTTIFHHLDRFYSIVTRGLHYRYEPSAQKSGTIILTADGPAPPPALFDVCRGNLLYLLELTGAEGFVDQPEMKSADAWRTIVSFPVRWD
ncbi:MAG: hypothetical protein ACJ78Z_13760 [Myxococcales bacterium]